MGDTIVLVQAMITQCEVLAHIASLKQLIATVPSLIGFVESNWSGLVGLTKKSGIIDALTAIVNKNIPTGLERTLCDDFINSGTLSTLIDEVVKVCKSFATKVVNDAESVVKKIETHV